MSRVHVVMGPVKFIFFLIILFLIIGSLLAVILPYILTGIAIVGAGVGGFFLVKYIRKKKGMVK